MRNYCFSYKLLIHCFRIKFCVGNKLIDFDIKTKKYNL